MKKLRHISAFLTIFALLISIASEAQARRRSFGIPLLIFGQSDEVFCLQDIGVKGNDGEELCLAEYNVYNFFFAGVGTTSTLVMGQKKGKIYYDIPTGDELKSLQHLGLLPTPLPRYSRPFLDYLYGYSLWIILSIAACAYLLVRMIRWRARTPSRLQKQEVIFASILRRVLVAAMLSDGSIDEEEKKAIKNVYKQITGADMSDAELGTVITALMTEQESFNKALKQTSAKLTDDAKKLLVTASIMVLCADGQIEDSEMSFIVDVANTLSMSQPQFRQVLSNFPSDSMETQPN